MQLGLHRIPLFSTLRFYLLAPIVGSLASILRLLFPNNVESQILNTLLAKLALRSAARFCWESLQLCRASALFHQIEESAVDVGRRLGKIGPAQPERQSSEVADPPMPSINVQKREEGQLRTGDGEIDNSR